MKGMIMSDINPIQALIGEMRGKAGTLFEKFGHAAAIANTAIDVYSLISNKKRGKNFTGWPEVAAALALEGKVEDAVKVRREFMSAAPEDVPPEMAFARSLARLLEMNEVSGVTQEQSWEGLALLAKWQASPTESHIARRFIARLDQISNAEEHRRVVRAFFVMGPDDPPDESAYPPFPIGGSDADVQDYHDEVDAIYAEREEELKWALDEREANRKNFVLGPGLDKPSPGETFGDWLFTGINKLNQRLGSTSGQRQARLVEAKQSKKELPGMWRSVLDAFRDPFDFKGGK